LLGFSICDCLIKSYAAKADLFKVTFYWEEGLLAATFEFDENQLHLL
jgi:hypothetical protein